MIKRFSPTLKELMAGCVFAGLLVMTAGIIITGADVSFIIGLCVGLVVAIIMAVTMENGIKAALDMGGSGGSAHVRKNFLIRYICIVAAFIILGFINKRCIIPCFLGVMTLKASVYIQPLVHKIIKIITKSHDEKGREELIKGNY